jgi:hypothetical protein
MTKPTDDIYMLGGGEAPPNICRQKHGHKNKDSSTKNENMKSTSEIMTFLQRIQLMQFVLLAHFLLV